jgi:hypothetical protein
MPDSFINDSTPDQRDGEEDVFVSGETPSSRYRMTSLFFDRGMLRYGLWDPPDIQLTGAEIKFVLPPEMEHRPDLVSYQFYGNVDFWWAIMHVNGVMLPIRDLVAGMVLLIPSADSITEALQRSRR